MKVYLSKDTRQGLIAEAQDDLLWSEEIRTALFTDDEIDSLIVALKDVDADMKITLTQRQLDWIMEKADSSFSHTLYQ